MILSKDFMKWWGGMVCNILVFLMLLYGMISK